MRIFARALAATLVLCSVVVGPIAGADTATDLARAQAELARLAHESNLLVDDYNRHNERLARVRAEVERARARLDALHEKLDEARRAARRQAVDLYKYGSTQAAASISSFTAAGSADIARADAYLDAVQQHTVRTMDELGAVREDTDIETKRLAAIEAEQRRVVDALATRRREIETKVARQREITERFKAQLEEERRREQEEARQRLAAAAARGRGSTRDDPNVPASNPRAAAAVAFARAQLGEPYRWGATGPDSWDCSGLTQAAWDAAGVGIPRTSSEQAASLASVPMSERQPGDILWRSGHVALYIGGDTVIAAPQSGDVVSYKPASRYSKALRP